MGGGGGCSTATNGCTWRRATTGGSTPGAPPMTRPAARRARPGTSQTRRRRRPQQCAVYQPVRGRGPRREHVGVHGRVPRPPHPGSGSNYNLHAHGGWYIPVELSLTKHQKYHLVDDSYERADTIGFRCVSDVAVWPRGGLENSPPPPRPRPRSKVRSVYTRTTKCLHPDHDPDHLVPTLATKVDIIVPGRTIDQSP